MRILAIALTGLILLQGCAGSMANTSGPGATPAEKVEAGSDGDTNTSSTRTATRPLWPWIVGGAAVAAVALVAFVYIAAEGAANAAGQAAANSGGGSGRSDGPITVAGR